MWLFYHSETWLFCMWKHTDWYTYVYKHAAIAGRVGLQKWMICDPHKSSKCGWFVINVNWNLIYLVIHKVVISLYKAVSIMFSHMVVAQPTRLSQPCHNLVAGLLQCQNPKVFQASYQLVTRLLIPLQTRLWQPCSMGETTNVFSIWALLLPQSVRLFLLCLTDLMQCPFVPLSLSSTITLRPLLLHFDSCTIFFDHLLVGPIPRGPGLLHFDSHTITLWSPRGQTSTTWLVVWGETTETAPTPLKVWRIYIYIQMRADYTARLVASAKALGNYVPDNRTFYLFWSYCLPQ